MSPPRPVTLGLVGAGRIGRLHAENARRRLEGARLVAVADVVEPAARALADALEIPRATGDYRALLDDPTIEAILICSATDTHARIIEEAAQAGKEIFCEKPIALSLEATDRALAAVERAGVRLQVGFNRRFDPTHGRLRRAVERGEIGEPHLIHIVSRDPAPPPLEYLRVSGGIFVDMMIHDFDMARYLVGSEISSLYATGALRIDPAIGEAGDIDTALVSLRFENGVLGSIDNSRRAVYGYDQRIELFGSGGSIRAENHHDNAATILAADRVYRDPPQHFFVERYSASYLAEIEAFLDAIRTGAPVPVSGADARAALVVALAAKRSYEEGREIRIG